jgi:hypothetical protein
MVSFGGFSEPAAAIKSACAAPACRCSTQSGHGMGNIRGLGNPCTAMPGCCRVKPFKTGSGNNFYITRTKTSHPILLVIPAIDEYGPKKTSRVNIGKSGRDVTCLWPFMPLYLRKMSILC